MAQGMRSMAKEWRIQWHDLLGMEVANFDTHI